MRVHEVLVRTFTTILDELSCDVIRDPYGGLTVILADVDRAALQCLAEMLYRGVTLAPSAKVKSWLMSLTKVPATEERPKRGRPKKSSIVKWPEVDFCEDDPLSSLSQRPQANSPLFDEEEDLTALSDGNWEQDPEYEGQEPFETEDAETEGDEEAQIDSTFMQNFGKCIFCDL